MLSKYRRLKILKGFSLIELITVMAIIAILAAISMFALTGSRASARDTKRKADIQAMASAFEIFKADCNYYPYGTDLPAAGSSFTGSGCTPSNTNTYMQVYPDDSLSGRDYSVVALGCVWNGTRWICQRFRIWAALEDPPATLPSGCPGPAPACGSATCNFCIYNP